jgi:hypothetical protein
MMESRWTFLGELSPFIRGLTLFFWVTGTWWIPLLMLRKILKPALPSSYRPLSRSSKFNRIDIFREPRPWYRITIRIRAGNVASCDEAQAEIKLLCNRALKLAPPVA